MITYTVTVDDGDTEWYLNGELHREDGPALEATDGFKAWFLDGKCHRVDGPAVEWPLNHDGRGHKCWYLNGEKLTEAEFNARMNPPKELTVAEIEKLLGYSVKVVE